MGIFVRVKFEEKKKKAFFPHNQWNWVQMMDLNCCVPQECALNDYTLSKYR